VRRLKDRVIALESSPGIPSGIMSPSTASESVTPTNADTASSVSNTPPTPLPAVATSLAKPMPPDADLSEVSSVEDDDEVVSDLVNDLVVDQDDDVDAPSAPTAIKSGRSGI